MSAESVREQEAQELAKAIAELERANRAIDRLFNTQEGESKDE